jgi:hypothetical protein
MTKRIAIMALGSVMGLSGVARAQASAEVTFDESRPVIAVYRDGMWFIDDNGNHAWDDLPIDEELAFGEPGDWPVALPHPFCSSTPAVVHGSTWIPQDTWGLGLPAEPFEFGGDGLIPLYWGGVTTFDAGLWRVDRNLDGQWDEQFLFGRAGDIPVTGRWSDKGSRMGVFDTFAGWWYLDMSGDDAWGKGDVRFQFGEPGDFPIVDDFNPQRDGDEIGVFRDGAWYIDMNGNRKWNGDRGDATWFFGQEGDIPVILAECR